MAKYYVVWKGFKRGVFESWEECQLATKGFPDANFKAFPTKEAAEQAFAPYSKPSSGVRTAKPKAGGSTNSPKFTVIKRSPLPVQIYCDGACVENPGPCASAVAVFENGELLESWAGAYQEQGTNNIAELNALLKALEFAQKYADLGKQAEIIGDSLYSLNAVFTWARGWEAKGWTKKDGPIANLGLIQACYALAGTLGDSVQVTHVEGHRGSVGNELVDRLATQAITLDNLKAA